jgi:ankyrin repeat protein
MGTVFSFLCFKPKQLGKTIHKFFRMSPLNTAAIYGHLEVIKTLVAVDGDIETPNEDGKTCLIRAAMENERDCVELLLQLNADTSKTDRFGYNVFKSSNKSVQELLESHAKKSAVERERSKEPLVSQFKIETGRRLMVLSFREFCTQQTFDSIYIFFMRKEICPSCHCRRLSRHVIARIATVCSALDHRLATELSLCVTSQEDSSHRIGAKFDSKNSTNER